MSEEDTRQFKPIPVSKWADPIPEEARRVRHKHGDPYFPFPAGQEGLAWYEDNEPADPPDWYTFRFRHSDGLEYEYLSFLEDLEWMEPEPPDGRTTAAPDAT